MSTPASSKPKHVPKVAIIGADAAGGELLKNTFQQFKIEVVPVGASALEDLHKRKFEGVVLKLDEEAPAMLEAIRTSPRNRQVTILGMCTNPSEAIRFSKYGINAVLKYPLERQDTMRAVRSTHLLILHELRRYVRVPLVLEVHLELMGGNRVAGVTRDISYGGLSLKLPTKISPETYTDMSFTLPNGTQVRVGGTVLWFHPPELVGIRFELTDERRTVVRRWIDEYLEIG